MSLDVQEVVRATGAELLKCGPSVEIRSVSTDTRRLEPGALFVALRGARFDGHQFLSEAVEKGARALLVGDRSWADRVARPDVAVFAVRDPLRALGDLAHHLRERNRPVVVAITGSNGKTTTKEMTFEILAAEYGSDKVLKNAGNENNLIGVPLTLLRLAQEKVAVVELGTSGPGEIARLAEISDPDVGVITNVGPAHLEGLGSIEGVARAKGELLRGMRPGTTAVLNGDDARVRALAESFSGRVVLFGDAGEIRAEGRVRQAALGHAVEFEMAAGARRVPVRINCLGRHNVSNALAAAAAALAVGVGLEAIKVGLERVRPVSMRMELITLPCGARLISDCYNANPASVKAALETLRDVETARRWAVLGDMCELGERGGEFHREVGLFAAGLGLWRLYLMGEHAADTAAGARRGGLGVGQVRIFDTHDQIAEELATEIGRGDCILVKGSRRLRMEAVVERLLQSRG